jgi:hypothetical protein
MAAKPVAKLAAQLAARLDAKLAAQLAAQISSYPYKCASCKCVSETLSAFLMRF